MHILYLYLYLYTEMSKLYKMIKKNIGSAALNGYARLYATL